MNEDRNVRINELAGLLWDKASDALHPEASWASILAEHCKDDPSLSDDVRLFVKASEGEDLEVKGQLNVLPIAATEIDVPETIGDYKIVSILGVGGMGVVFAAEFKGPGMEARPVAVKVAKKSAHADAVMRRLRAEINLLSRLDHPHIVEIYTAGTTEDGSPYLVMELVEGSSTLDQYCTASASSLEQRVQLFVKVCAATEYLHEKNIVHRDLTIGNILVTKSGEPQIVDFGLAVFLHPVESAPTYANSNLTARRLGTPGYMSPEQARGEEGRTSDDVWALGTVLDLLIRDAPLASPGSTRLKRALEKVVAE